MDENMIDETPLDRARRIRLSNEQRALDRLNNIPDNASEFAPAPTQEEQDLLIPNRDNESVDMVQNPITPMMSPENIDMLNVDVTDRNQLGPYVNKMSKTVGEVPSNDMIGAGMPNTFNPAMNNEEIPEVSEDKPKRDILKELLGSLNPIPNAEGQSVVPLNMRQRNFPAAKQGWDETFESFMPSNVQPPLAQAEPIQPPITKTEATPVENIQNEVQQTEPIQPEPMNTKIDDTTKQTVKVSEIKNDKPIVGDEPVVESDYQKALKNKQRMDALALILQGSQKFAAGLAGRGLTDIKVDSSTAQMLQKMGTDDLDMAIKNQDNLTKKDLDRIKLQYQNARLLKMQSDLKNKTDLSNDPESESSKVAQQQLKDIGYSGKVDGLSEELIKKNFSGFLRKSETELQRKREERLSDKFGYQKAEKFENDAEKAFNDMNKDPVYSQSKQMLSETRSVRDLIEDAYSKGGPSLAMLGSKLAKGVAGEKGVLTDQDVVRYLQSAGLLNQAQDIFAKATEGKLSEVSKENLTRLMNIVEDATKVKMDNVINERAMLFSRRENIPYEDARFLIDSQFQKNTKISPNEIKTASVNTESKKPAPGAIVVIKGKRYRVAEDGDTLIQL